MYGITKGKFCQGGKITFSLRKEAEISLGFYFPFIKYG